MRNKYLYLSIVFFTLLTLFSRSIPFFWDGTFFSEIAVNFYEKEFNSLIIEGQPDTGGFPLYSLYLAFCWKLFGKSLLVSHLALLPFVAGICHFYFKLANRFLLPGALPLAFILLLCEPCLVTQSMLMGYDLLMICFFLMALYSLLSGNKSIFALSLIFLTMCSMRGVMLGASLMATEILLQREISFRNIKKYIPAVLIFSFWGIYHYTQTGWFFFSPEREQTDEALNSFPGFLKQLFFVGWKLSDLGRIALWLFLIMGSVQLLKKKNTAEFRSLMTLLFIPLLFLVLGMALLSNPVGPKYFIAVFLLLNIGVCYLWQKLERRSIKISLIVLFVISLLCGNLLMYPERFGNTWDASLKVIPYFPLKEKMDAYISENNIDPGEIGTQYPMIADKRFSHLSETSFAYPNVWCGPLWNYAYFLQSNVINTDIPEQVEEVKKSWILLKKVTAGPVYISLYKNPRR
jgi:hypothetical protein